MESTSAERGQFPTWLVVQVEGPGEPFSWKLRKLLLPLVRLFLPTEAEVLVPIVVRTEKMAATHVFKRRVEQEAAVQGAMEAKAEQGQPSPGRTGYREAPRTMVAGEVDPPVE